MRIISPFRDFYDNVAGPNLRDDLPVYTRSTKTHDLQVFRAPGSAMTEEALLLGDALEFFLTMPSVYGVQCAVLIVAGRSYPLYLFRDLAFSSVPEVLASPVVAQAAWVKQDIEREMGKRAQPCFRYRDQQKSGGYRFPQPFNAAGWAAHVAFFGVNPAASAEAHRHFEAPVLLVEWSTRKEPFVRPFTVTANPNLRKLGVTKLQDPELKPAAVYQRIDQYLGNEMAQQVDPMPTRSQELIRDAHGFDECSFRNTKPDRRARKAE